MSRFFIALERNLINWVSARALRLEHMNLSLERPFIERVDPELRQSMERLAKLQIQPQNDSQQSFLESVRHNIALNPGVGGVPRAVQTENLELRPDLKARLYRPNLDSSRSAVPVLIYAHGGGFASGNLESHDVFLRALCQDSSVAILALDYRLAPEYPFPAALEDLNYALSWLEGHGPEFGLDPARASVGGDSAGAGLAAVAALEWNCASGNAPLRAQLLIQPNTDLTLEQNSWHQNRPFGPTPHEMKEYLKLYLPLEHDEKDPQVSVLFSADLSCAPFTVLITGGCDPLEDDGLALKWQLEVEGVALEHLRFEGATHGFYFHLGAVELSRRGVLELAGALNRVLSL